MNKIEMKICSDIEKENIETYNWIKSNIKRAKILQKTKIIKEKEQDKLQRFQEILTTVWAIVQDGHKIDGKQLKGYAAIKYFNKSMAPL